MPPDDQMTPSPGNETREAARDYIRHGGAIIPVPHRSKNPGMRGWQRWRLSEDDLPVHFGADPMNIGLLLGEPSGWVVDVDLDHPRAIELADDYLPESPAVFGRPGKLRSHRLYRVTAPLATKKHKSKSAGMIVELRSTGAQTIVPPSMHESGEPIAWETEGAEPAEVDPEKLLAAVKRLADAILVELGEKASPKLKLHRADNTQRAESDGGSTDPRGRCLTAILKMRLPDQRDGSARLFAAACRCVEHNLSEDEALSLIRLYASQRPFPRTWTDEEIRKRLSDAETKCKRGKALEEHGFSTGGTKPNQAAQLVALAEEAGVALFHDGDKAYATATIGDHIETWPLRSRAFRLWLARLFYLATNGAANSQATQDAMGVLSAKALFDGPERRVAVRIAEHDDAIWLDLADDQWNAVRIDASGWQVVASDAVPVRFVRRRAMQALPAPVTGGSIEELRPFLNLREESDWVLLISWLIGAFRPSGSHPILNVCGEQGTAKTTLCRMLRALVDPNKSPVRCEPSSRRDLMIAASNAWLFVLDNMSGVPVWLSDALCRLATGGGLSTRELYSDDDEIVLDAVRPLILNGIASVATRSDLLDRCVTLTLEPIPDDRRRIEADLWAEFEAARPRILGALLTAVSVAIRRVATIRLPAIPRMADFAVWATAAEPGLGLSDGAFIRAYAGDRAASQESMIENSAIGKAIVGLVTSVGVWKGTQTELLAELNTERHSNEHTRRMPDWPRTPRKLAEDLRRLAPSLRAVGVSVDIGRREGRRKRREIVLEKSPAERSARSAWSACPAADPSSEGYLRTVATEATTVDTPQRAAGTAISSPATPDADRADHADHCAPPDSGGAGAESIPDSRQAVSAEKETFEI